MIKTYLKPIKNSVTHKEQRDVLKNDHYLRLNNLKTQSKLQWTVSV